MTATIQPYNSGINEGFIIVCKDNQGNIINKIAATEVIVEGTPCPKFELLPGNKMRLVR